MSIPNKCEECGDGPDEGVYALTQVPNGDWVCDCCLDSVYDGGNYDDE